MVLIIFVCILLLNSKILPIEENVSYDDASTEIEENEEELRYHIAKVNFEGVKMPFTLSLWILIVCFCKLLFTKSKFLEEYVPESCMLILLGIVVGLFIFFVFAKEKMSASLSLSTDLFFLILLPPIILEAGFSMPRRPFFDNIGLILLLAIVGTLFNTLAIGFSLYGVSAAGGFGVKVNAMQCLLFASLISAVDPVAILAVFDEIHVNEVLYIVVFGESLLNDGVAIVLYNMFGAFNKIGSENLKGIDIGAGVISFFVVAGVGTLIGVVFAVIIAFTTKYTHEVPLLEPIIVIIIAYLSYIFADMFELSGILAAIFCGLIMRKYVERNLSQTSNTTLAYILKLSAGLSESVIFLLFGMSTVHRNHVANGVFIISSLLFCIIYRVIASFFLIKVANRKKLNKLSNLDIFIVAYSGLRGAIAFSLSTLISEKEVGTYTKNMFETTTVIIVLFTSFVQGISIKPLVYALNIKIEDKKQPTTIAGILFTDMFDYLSVFISDLVGEKGMKQLREKFNKLDSRFIKPYLLKRKDMDKKVKLAEQVEQLNAAEINEHLYIQGWDLSLLDYEKIKRKMSCLPANKIINESKDEDIQEMMDDILTRKRRKTYKYSKLTINKPNKLQFPNFQADSLFPQNVDASDIENRRKTLASENRNSSLSERGSSNKLKRHSSCLQELRTRNLPSSGKLNFMFDISGEANSFEKPFIEDKEKDINQKIDGSKNKRSKKVSYLNYKEPEDDENSRNSKV